MSEFWDNRFAGRDYAYGTEPNAFLAAQRALLKPGMCCLAVADGEGRNGVWLAQQGLEVLAVDSSSVGLTKARTLATQRAVALKTELADLLTWEWPVAQFDIVAAIFIHFMPAHRARMHAAMLRALKPGGVLIMEAFHQDQLQYNSGGPPVREMLYSADMLRTDFSGVSDIVLLEECITELAEGLYHRGKAAVVRLICSRR